MLLSHFLESIYFMIFYFLSFLLYLYIVYSLSKYILSFLKHVCLSDVPIKQSFNQATSKILKVKF